ncbi:MAG: ankyrin repeat domain-containing protein [Ignavibacteriaceae bacterium]|nr:ankyrin repeat domain-containing protein [Ignavibacteriaceae bacterium]
MKFIFILAIWVLEIHLISPQQFHQLADAVIDKDTIKIEQLLQSGVDMNTQHPTSGTTVLMIASSDYYYDDMVDYLIRKGAKLDLQDSEGKTALLWAASNSLPNAKILVANGANVNINANDGMTPFLQATLGVSSGKVSIELCDLLRKNGAKINASLTKKSVMGWTALHYAAINGDAELVKYLIKYGANVNKSTGEGSTPLYLAKLGNHEDVISVLKKAGAKE